MNRDTLISIIGEGIHTSLRKGTDDPYAGQAWVAIQRMPDEEWNRVLNFLVDGLEVEGVLVPE